MLTTAFLYRDRLRRVAKAGEDYLLLVDFPGGKVLIQQPCPPIHLLRLSEQEGLAFLLEEVGENKPWSEGDIVQELYDASYVAGIIVGALITSFVFFLASMAAGMGQYSNAWVNFAQDLKDIGKMGGLIVGIIALIIKILQIPWSVITTLLLQFSFIVPLLILIGTAIFSVISAIGNQDKLLLGGR